MPATCPKCGASDSCYRTKTKDGGIGRIRCRRCARPFTVRFGTPLSDRQVPLDRLCFALHLSQTAQPDAWESALTDAGFAELTARRTHEWLQLNALPAPEQPPAISREPPPEPTPPDLAHVTRGRGWTRNAALTTAALLLTLGLWRPWNSQQIEAGGPENPTAEEGVISESFMVDLEALNPALKGATFSGTLKTKRKDGQNAADWNESHMATSKDVKARLPPK